MFPPFSPPVVCFCPSRMFLSAACSCPPCIRPPWMSVLVSIPRASVPPQRLRQLAVGHVIPDANILALTIAEGPTGAGPGGERERGRGRRGWGGQWVEIEERVVGWGGVVVGG